MNVAERVNASYASLESNSMLSRYGIDIKSFKEQFRRALDKYGVANDQGLLDQGALEALPKDEQQNLLNGALWTYTRPDRTAAEVVIEQYDIRRNSLSEQLGREMDEEEYTEFWEIFHELEDKFKVYYNEDSSITEVADMLQQEKNEEKRRNIIEQFLDQFDSYGGLIFEKYQKFYKNYKRP